MRETPSQLFFRALKNGQVDDLFAGRNGYYLPPGKTVDGNDPVDYNLLFYWIHKSCSKEDVSVYKKAVKEAIVKLLNGDPEDVYCAYSACWSELFLELDKKAAFTICDEQFLNYVREKCLENKEDLVKCHKWTGMGEPEGVWRQMQSSSENLKKFYGVMIL